MKENLFYLPPYEDEATAEKIREIYGYPIRYMKQYLLASLYNAPTTMQLSYQNQTNHDLANRR